MKTLTRTRFKLALAAASVAAPLGVVAVATEAPMEAEAASCSYWWFQASGGASAGATSYCPPGSWWHKVRVYCSNGGSYVGNAAAPGHHSFASCPWGTSATGARVIFL